MTAIDVGGRAFSPRARCRRCERRVGLAGPALRAGLELCAECLPRFEAALAAWLASTAGARGEGPAVRRDSLGGA